MSLPERLVKSREVLEEVVARVHRLVKPAAVAAYDVGSHAMQLLLLRQFNGAADDRGVRHLDVGIKEQNKLRIGQRGAAIASYSRHAARDDAHVQSVAETQNDFGRAIGRIRVSY